MWFPIYWISPAAWSLDTSFEQGSGFIWWNFWVQKIKEVDSDVYLWWDYVWYNGTTSINSSSVRSMLALLDNGVIDTTKFTWANVWWVQIWSVSKTADGKYIIVLFGTTYHTNTVTRWICRLNSDFSFDDTFSPWVFTWTPSYAKVMSDWKILITTQSSTLVKLNSDWSIDNTFTTPTFNWISSYILERSDWKYIVWWSFTTVNWNSINSLVLLNTDWTVDSSLNSWAWYNNATAVFAVKQADDKIILFWSLTTYRWTTVNRIVRVNTDWTIDWTFVTGTWFNWNTNCADIQADWKIVIWWDFTTYKGVSWFTRIIRLDTDGTADWTFVTGTGFWASVSSVIIDTNQRIFVWWSFTTYNNVSQLWYCIKLNSDWTKYTTFEVWTGFNGLFFSWIKSIALGTGWILCITWNHSEYNWFQNYNAQNIQILNKLNNSWILDISLPKKKWFWWFVAWWTLYRDLDVLGTKIVVSGDFTSYDGNTTNRIALLNTNWTIDTGFTSWTWFASSPLGVVFCNDWWFICVWWFTAYNGTTRNRIVKIKQDWTIDSTFAYTSWFSLFTSWWIAKQADWKVIVFQNNARTYNWANSNRVHRINTDWTIDSTFMTNIWTWPNLTASIAFELNDWTIIIWWQFTSWNGVSWYNRVIALNNDWTVNTNYDFWTGFDNTVLCVWGDDNWNVYLWWDFTTYKGNTANRLVKISNTWTVLQTYWTWLNSTCRTMNIVWNRMYIWWYFTQYNWITVGNIARIFI